jgi:hypothetical protein
MVSSEVICPELTLLWSGWPWQRRRRANDSDPEVARASSEHATWLTRGTKATSLSPALLSNTTSQDMFPTETHINIFTLNCWQVHLSSESPQSSENDSGVLNMSPGIGRSASRPSPDTSRTPSSTLLPFKSSGFMRTMILFGPAFRNPYLSQNCSTGA